MIELALLGILMVLGVLLIVGLVLFFFIFWIMMIVDAAQRKFRSDSDKIVWILIIVFLHILGAIIYYFVVKKNKK